MNKIAKLTKIANHLDSLGLTSEANVLDNIIRKIAADGYVPDGQKYIDAYGTRLGVMNKAGLIAELKDELDPYNGTTDSGDMFSTGITKIESILYYLGANTSTRHFFEVFDLLKSAGFDTSGYIDMDALLESEDKGLVNKCSWAFGTGIKDYNTANTAPAPSPVPVPEATNNVVATGWDTYVSQTSGGNEVKKAWIAFASIFGQPYTPKFYSFVSWYNGQKKSAWSGKDKSPKDVVTTLNNLSNSHTNPVGAGGGFTGEGSGMGLKR